MVDEHDPAVMLARLVADGWTGQVVGDPAAPVMLVYTRPVTCPQLYGDADVMDELIVMDADDVSASRHVAGTVTLNASGTMTTVVDAVTAWPTSTATRHAS